MNLPSECFRDDPKRLPLGFERGGIIFGYPRLIAGARSQRVSEALGIDLEECLPAE
jgi:hypothetical protein